MLFSQFILDILTKTLRLRIFMYVGEGVKIHITSTRNIKKDKQMCDNRITDIEKKKYLSYLVGLKRG